MGRKRKGQWFLIGGFFLIIFLSYAVMSRTQISIGSDTIARDFVFENIKDSTRSALSEIVMEDTSTPYVEAHLIDWKHMIQNFAHARALNLSGFIVLGIPYDGFINVSIINFFQQDVKNISFSVGVSSVPSFDLADGNITTIYFPESSNYFLVNMSYDAGWQENICFNTTRKAFFMYQMRLVKREGMETLQHIEYG